MSRHTNPALKIAGVALALSCLSGALAGCSGSDSDGGSASDKPQVATVEGFCEKVAGLTTTLAEGDPKDSAATVEGIQDWIAEMEDYGTPSELSGEAKVGFETLVATLEGVEDDASFEDLQRVVSDVSAADNKKMTTFGTWSNENCAAAAPSDDAS